MNNNKNISIIVQININDSLTNYSSDFKKNEFNCMNDTCYYNDTSKTIDNINAVV